MSLLDTVARSFVPTEKAASNVPQQGSVIAAAVTQADEMPARSTKGLLEFYQSNPLLHMVASKVGDLVASECWHVGVVDRSTSARTVSQEIRKAATSSGLRRVVRDLQDTAELNEIEAHPFLDMLNGRNGMLLGRELRKLNQIYLDTVGESFSLMIPNGLGVPNALEPLVPTDVLNLPTPSKPFFRVQIGAETQMIPAEMIFCVRDPSPLSPYGRGVGHGRALADELEIDEYSAKWTKNFFKNGARPDLLISAPNMNPAERIRLEKSWMSRLRDFRRQWLPFMLRAEEGLTIQELSNKFSSEISELRDRQRDFVMQVFGISPEIFGVLSNSNRATIQEAQSMLAKQVIIPRLEIWREAFQERLLPVFDERLVVWYDDPTPEDEERQDKTMLAFPYASTVNEQRLRAGLEPLEDGGEVYMVPSGLTAQEDLRAVKAASPVPPSPPPEAPEPPEIDEEDEEDRQHSSAVERAHDPARDVYADFARLLSEMEGRLSEAFREAVERMRDEIDEDLLARILAEELTSQIEQAVPLVLLSENFLESYNPWALDAVRRFGAQAADRLEDIIGDVEGLNTLSTTARQWVEEHGAELVREIDQSTRRGLQELLDDAFASNVSRRKLATQIKERVGLTQRQMNALLKEEAELLESGMSPSQVASRMRRHYREKIRDRARLIARTETSLAGNKGQEEVNRQAIDEGLIPPQAKKRWLLSPAPCEVCIAIEAAGPVGLNAPFRGGGYVGNTPPAHPRCRCAYQTFVPDEAGEEIDAA